MEETVWLLLNLLKDEFECNNLGLLILNQPLQPDFGIFKKLWSKASVKACADGGTNELYDTTGDSRDMYLPDWITGDFDSARTEVLQYYRNKGVKIQKTEDQNYTDFTKLYKHLIETEKQQIDTFVVFGGFGGRVDQVFANIETLFTIQNMTSSKPVYLVSSHSIAVLLPKGRHRLQVDSGYEGDWCGLVPVGCPCRVTTTGLKWNLDKQQLKFGELVSTSNTWETKDTDIVTIETDNYLLWTMGVKL